MTSVLRSCSKNLHFQAPQSGNIESGSSSGVTDETALSGSQSYRVEFQFNEASDGDDSNNWLRLTTFSFVGDFAQSHRAVH